MTIIDKNIIAASRSTNGVANHDVYFDGSELDGHSGSSLEKRRIYMTLIEPPMLGRAVS